MALQMPCGKETVEVIDYPEEEAEPVVEAVLAGGLFGFVKCKIRAPQHMWPKFEEMASLLLNREVPDAAVPPEMMEYLQRTGRKRATTRKLVGALEAGGILLYPPPPLLKWYLEHGLVVDAVYSVINYTPKKIFTLFVEQVTEARRMGDVSEEKALLAEAMKLLGNPLTGN